MLINTTGGISVHEVTVHLTTASEVQKKTDGKRGCGDRRGKGRGGEEKRGQGTMQADRELWLSSIRK